MTYVLKVGDAVTLVNPEEIKSETNRVIYETMLKRYSFVPGQRLYVKAAFSIFELIWAGDRQGNIFPLKPEYYKPAPPDFDEAGAL